MYNGESQGKMKTIPHIFFFVVILPMGLIGHLITPILKLAEVIGDLWQRTGELPEHGMYATITMKMKEQLKQGGSNGLV